MNNTIFETPFAINFLWENTGITITLINGEDIFKLMEIYKSTLEKAKIRYTEEVSTNDPNPI